MALIAVVDVETTGLNPYRHDRIIEVAIVVVRDDGTTVRELSTLVNPERDIGPTRVHGLTARDVIAAPRFQEIAGTLLETLDGCTTIAGHNVRFDLSFLTAEFDRVGHRLPECPTLCTMHLAGGGSLSRVCCDYGILFDGDAHSALHDARATAHLLAELLRDAPTLSSSISDLPPIAWGNIPKMPAKLLTREDARKRQAQPPSYIDTLLTRTQPDLPPDTSDSAVLAYTALLDRVLADRHVDEEEGNALVEVARNWAMSGEQVRRVHWEYLVRLGATALADGSVTDIERQDLTRVGYWLGLDQADVESALVVASRRPPTAQQSHPTSGLAQSANGLAGKCVCFTGECQGQGQLNGMPITREMAMKLAIQHGMVVTESVTKKLDVLVTADSLTQSGKAKKARQYGIPIMDELVFWRALGLEVG